MSGERRVFFFCGRGTKAHQTRAQKKKKKRTTTNSNNSQTNTRAHAHTYTHTHKYTHTKKRKQACPNLTEQGTEWKMGWLMFLLGEESQKKIKAKQCAHTCAPCAAWCSVCVVKRREGGAIEEVEVERG